MILLLPLNLFLPFITGAGWLLLRKEKERSSPGQSYLMGLMTLFILAQLASFITIKGELPFSSYCRIYCGLAAAVSIISLIIGRRALMEAFRNSNSVLSGVGHLMFGRRSKAEKEVGNRTLESIEKNELRRIKRETLIILVVILMQCCAYLIYIPDTGNSTMAETISVTTLTDTVFKYNPTTGLLLERGIYPIYKLASLPLFYSFLYSISGMRLSIFIFIIIPIWISLVAIAVMILWGEVLSRGMRERRVLFLMFYSLLMLMRGGVKGTYAYAIMHEAFKGKCLVLAVMVPLFLCGLYLIYMQNEKLYGGAMSLLSLGGILFSIPLIWTLNINDFLGVKNTEWTVLSLVMVIMLLLWDRARLQWHKKDIVFLVFILICSAIPGSVVSYLGLAYCLTRICDMAREWGYNKRAYLGIIIIICLYGTVLPLRSPQLKRWEIPREYIEALEDIDLYRKEIIQNNGGMEPIVLAEDRIMEIARVRGDGTRLIYGKDMWIENCNREIADEYPGELRELHRLMEKDYEDPDTVAEMAEKLGVDIIFLREHIEPELCDSLGYIGPVDRPGYAIYVRN